ncbi:Gibberellin cluster GA4 desaturase [Pseudocercospora fuligena]|uniref:Gibberellin cluster GA4 desaturase n=1 Tax=Pseudocercospora fuligena TaxID=685502 RepID=A0A8H6VE84_9PEZI|nr:Gibberellin cluster GA4 desaturase [Pseudocercospora fuligena]
MGSIGNPPSQKGFIRFTVPDNSIPPEERGLFGIPGNKLVKEEEIDVIDYRNATDENVVKEPQGLDVQGFTYVEHFSSLIEGDKWFELEGEEFEKVYFEEVKELICKVTGASRAVVNNSGFRRKPVALQNDPNWVHMKGTELDKMLCALPRDRALLAGHGSVDSSLEPLRGAHIDYSQKGLRDTARYCRKDIYAAAKKALDAEDRLAAGEQVKVPRYAAYSVWRPTKTVKRDGLAVSDWRCLDESEIEPFSYRSPSNVTESGEFFREGSMLLPPKKPEQQKWYTMTGQQPHEVLILKLGDTAADADPGIAKAAAHCAPRIEGQENEEARSSVECRVLVFWDE